MAKEPTPPPRRPGETRTLTGVDKGVTPKPPAPAKPPPPPPPPKKR